MILGIKNRVFLVQQNKDENSFYFAVSGNTYDTVIVTLVSFSIFILVIF